MASVSEWLGARMKDWNMLVTVLRGPGREHHVLRELNLLGEFHGTEFRDVCTGRVEDAAAFLETLLRAVEAGAAWTRDLARAIPMARTFRFTPETLIDELQQAVAPLLERMHSGSFYVRVERRGLEGEVVSPEVERAVADHLFALAQAQGKALRTSFDDPDYIVVAETLGHECGVALLTREQRRRYPFVQAR